MGFNIIWKYVCDKCDFVSMNKKLFDGHDSHEEIDIDEET